MKTSRARQIQLLIENEIIRARTQARFAILPDHPVFSDQSSSVDSYCSFYLKTLECLENVMQEKKG